jgi:PAP2 superfamily
MEQSSQFPKLKTATTLLLIAGAIAFGLSRYFIIVVSLNAFPWLALLGCTVVQLRFRFKLPDILLAFAFVGVCALFRPQILQLPQLHRILGALLGLGSLLVMAARAVWSEQEDRIAYLTALIPSLLLVGSEWLTPPLLAWGQSANPKTLDLYLLVFDSTLGFQPSFWMGRLFERLPLLRTVSIACYLALPVLIALVYVEQLRQDRRRALVALLIFFSAAIIGASAYNLYPACGPISLLGKDFAQADFPFAKAARILLEPLPVSGPRNAMPSMHMSWVILAWWLTKNLAKWVKGIALGFVIFTVAATLGSGEHYFIDLIVALPFSLAMYALFSLDLPFTQKERLRALLGGALALFLWIVLLRFEIPLFVRFTGLSWILIALTIGWVSYAQRALSRARGLAAA